jgi:YD repeat-containing protein
MGNKVAQTDAEGRITRWQYDAMGREIARTLPGGQRETKAYNAAGELTAHTDFNGDTTRYRYTAGGYLEHTDYPNDADVSFQYNGAGERTPGAGRSRHQHHQLTTVAAA